MTIHTSKPTRPKGKRLGSTFVGKGEIDNNPRGALSFCSSITQDLDRVGTGMPMDEEWGRLAKKRGRNGLRNGGFRRRKGEVMENEWENGGRSTIKTAGIRRPTGRAKIRPVEFWQKNFQALERKSDRSRKNPTGRILAEKFLND